jgi:hypothetical protein
MNLHLQLTEAEFPCLTLCRFAESKSARNVNLATCASKLAQQKEGSSWRIGEHFGVQLPKYLPNIIRFVSL